MTVQDKRRLNIELHVNKGRGFVLASQHEPPRGAPVDMVRIDSIYNPVLRANFAVEETRVGTAHRLRSADALRRNQRIGRSGVGRSLRCGAGSEAPRIHALLR